MMFLKTATREKGSKEKVRWNEYPKGPIENGRRLELRRPYQSKVGPRTLVWNMGSALTCPSKCRGLCKLWAQFPDMTWPCYALKAEEIYPKTLPFRRRQEVYWKTTSRARKIDDICFVMDEMTRRKYEIDWLRFNESGDFYGKRDIGTVAAIAEAVKAEFNVRTFTYTAREDLKDLLQDGLPFNLKGSGFMAQNGQTMVVRRPNDRPAGWHLCPGDCRKCHVCKATNKNVAFVIH